MSDFRGYTYYYIINMLSTIQSIIWRFKNQGLQCGITTTNQLKTSKHDMQIRGSQKNLQDSAGVLDIVSKSLWSFSIAVLLQFLGRWPVLTKVDEWIGSAWRVACLRWSCFDSRWVVGEQGKLKIVWVAARHTILPAANTIYKSFCTIPLYYTYVLLQSHC